MNDVVVQKITSLQRCVARARDARARAGEDFARDFDRQDAAVLNALRACETAIDLANMLIRQQRLGVPAESRDSFGILEREGRIEAGLSQRLQRMVGFRNVAIHQYRELDPGIVLSVIDNDLDDLLYFAELVRQMALSPDYS
jgi:uncharacterized protein YutE (UPF0331/DUF86 family)